jgi:hypothetical protein
MASTFVSYVGEAKRRYDLLIRERVVQAAQRYERIWQESIREGDHSGRTYPVASGAKTDYQASAPGETPAIKTGALVKGITYEISKVGEMEWSALIGESVQSGRGSDVSRGRSIAMMLEFGTSIMDARPSWRPALAKLRVEMLAGGLFKG